MPGDSFDPFGDLGIHLNRLNRRARRGQVPGHLAVTRADFNPARIPALLLRSARRARSDPDGPRDLLAPARVHKKMLPEPLPRHAAQKCSSNGERARQAASLDDKIASSLLAERLDAPPRVR